MLPGILLESCRSPARRQVAFEVLCGVGTELGFRQVVGTIHLQAFELPE
jgi:hypothetical protein